MAKFLDRPQPYRRKARTIAASLGLHERRPIRILDVGCGVGFFVSACREMGHSAVGLDIPDRILQRAAGINGTPYHAHTIRAGVSLPEHLVNFELITMFGVNLRHADGARWKWNDFTGLVADVWPRIISGGEWVLRPNLTPETAFVLDASRWMTVLGATATCEASRDQINIHKKD